MGVHIHAGALRLFQQHFQIPQVVAGDQNARVFPCTDIDLGDLGIAVGLGVGLVQKGQDVYKRQERRGKEVKTVLKKESPS